MTLEVPGRDKLYTFLEEAGYSESDVLAFNPSTGKIATSNGGLYEVDEADQIIWHGGPPPDATDRM